MTSKILIDRANGIGIDSDVGDGMGDVSDEEMKIDLNTSSLGHRKMGVSAETNL